MHIITVDDGTFSLCFSAMSPSNVAETGGSGKGDVLSQRVTGECG